MRAHDDFVVISRRSLVAAASIHDRNKASIVLFHVAIGKAQLPQKFDSSHFEPNEIIRVIYNAHLIGFSIADSQAHFARVPAHLPLQRGLRFSRNEFMPSRKSAVCRMPAFSNMACST